MMWSGPATDYATLLRAPFSMSFAQIADMTDAQIYDLCFHEQDENGNLKRYIEAPEDLPPTKENQRAVLWSHGKALGMTDEQLMAAWLKKYPEG